MSSWTRVDECPPPKGAEVLCRGKAGDTYVAVAYYLRCGRYAGYAYRAGCARRRDRFPSPEWWCPIPEFDGEERRDG